MDIYMQATKTHWAKKVEAFGRKTFLLASSLFAVLIGTLFLLKSAPLSDAFMDVTMHIAEFLAIVWFSSFALWMVFLIANSRVGKFLKPKASTNRLVRLIEIIVIVILGFILVSFLLYKFVLRPHKTIGGSMTPNFVQGEYALSEKVTYYINQPKRGDIIVFNPPHDESQEFFARVIGIPGEYISIRKDHVYINNKILEEPYVGEGVKTNTGNFIGEINVLIPDSSYVVMGDNRPHSNDSRYYGFIDKQDIKGRFFYVYWPKDKTGFVKNPFVDTGSGNSIMN